MRQKKATPGKGREYVPDQFSYTPTPASLKAWYAWCAGEPEWFEVHEHTDRQPGTKICLAWATDGALECPRCRPFLKTTTCAYVPLYREMDTKSVVVICHDSVSDMLADLAFPMPVMVGRVTADASVFVRRTDGMAKFSSSLPDRQGPCNLLPSLLSMWKYPQYEQWLMTRHRQPTPHSPADTGASTTANNTSGSGESAKDSERELANELRSEGVFRLPVDDMMKKIKARRDGASSNGKVHTNGDGKHD